MSLLRIDFSGLQRLVEDFDINLAKIPRKVQQQLLTTAATSVLKQIRINARAQTHGQYSLPESDRRTIASAAYVDKRHINDMEPYVEINFKGTVNEYNEPRSSHPRQTSAERQDKTYHISYKTGIVENGQRRIAEIAFLNEYGVPRNKNQNAKGYLKDAMNEGMAKCMETLLDIIENYIADALVG